MSRFLLDTNIALIAVTDPDRLSTTVREILLSENCLISVIAYWEVMIKSMKGTLNVGDPVAWWSDTLYQLAATQLVLKSSHIAEVRLLPMLHKDPFDRVLMAQAIAEDFTLVTTDGDIPRYASERLRVVT